MNISEEKAMEIKRVVMLKGKAEDIITRGKMKKLLYYYKEVLTTLRLYDDKIQQINFEKQGYTFICHVI
jgi:hypothetical protein